MDNPVDQFKKLNHLELVVLVALFVGALAPGILTLWIYSPDLIKEASTPKLLLLGFSITLPLVMINFVFISMYRMIHGNRSIDQGFDYFFEFMNALIISGASYMFIDLLSLLFGFNLLVTVFGVLIVNILALYLATTKFDLFLGKKGNA